MGGTADPDSGRDPEEMFCLKWNDYQENVVMTLSELRAEEDFFDVTLAVDGEQVKAHKLVLSACSAFFRRLLRMNPGPNPVIVLWDVAFNDLLNIVDFMYNGEVKVRQANIQSFLAVAEKFRVRGLCQNDNNGASGRGSPDPVKRQPPPPASSSALPPATSTPMAPKSPMRGSSGAGASNSKRGFSPERGGGGGGTSSSDAKRSRAEGGGASAAAAADERGAAAAANNSGNNVDDEDRSPLTPDVSIREESQFSNAGSVHRGDHGGGHRAGSNDYPDWAGAGDQGDSNSGYDERNAASLQAFMGMGMGGLIDPGAAKEFLRRATALGLTPAAMAAAAAQTTSTATTPPGSSSGGGGGGSGSGGGGGMQQAGSPSDPAGLRRPRSVYNSQQVAQLEAYFRFNEYIDGERKRRLSQITQIPEHQIKVWFQNRRQKKKREEAEMTQSGGGSAGGGSGAMPPGMAGMPGMSDRKASDLMREMAGIKQEEMDATADFANAGGGGPRIGGVSGSGAGEIIHGGNIEDEDDDDDEGEDGRDPIATSYLA